MTTDNKFKGCSQSWDYARTLCSLHGLDPNSRYEEDMHWALGSVVDHLNGGIGTSTYRKAYRDLLEPAAEILDEQLTCGTQVTFNSLDDVASYLRSHSAGYTWAVLIAQRSKQVSQP